MTYSLKTTNIHVHISCTLHMKSVTNITESKERHKP